MGGNGKDYEKICGFCDFCHPWIDKTNNTVNPNTGICRRFPPQVVVITIKTGVVDKTGKAKTMQMAQPQFPFIDLITPACGEFKLAEERIGKLRLVKGNKGEAPAEAG